MKAVIASIALVAGLGLSTTAAAEIKIAVVRVAELVGGSPQYKAADEKMRKEFEARANELKAQGQALAEEIKAFQRDADILSAGDRAKREKELNTRRIDQNYAERQFQEDLAKRRNELLNEMRQSISDVIQTVAADEGYDLVVQDPVYASESIDITGVVLKHLSDKK